MPHAQTICRASEVRIETHKLGLSPWLRIVTQEVELQESGEIIASRPGPRQIIKSASETADDVHTVHDPVVGADVTVSGAGMAALIKSFADQYIEEAGMGTLGPVTVILATAEGPKAVEVSAVVMP